MANYRIFRIAKLSDKQIFKLFKEISAKFGDFSGDVTFANGISEKVDANSEIPELKRTSHAATRAAGTSVAVSVTVTFQRGISDTNFGNRIPSAYEDEIKVEVSISPVSLDLSRYLALCEIIESNTTVLKPAKTGEQSQLRVLNAELNTLKELAAELTIEAAKKRHELDSKEDALRAKYEAKEKVLDERRVEDQTNLEAEIAELAALRAELDDREHKHVRRELRETITGELKNNIRDTASPNLGSNTQVLAFAFAVVAAVFFGYLALQTQLAISTNGVEISYDPATGAEIARKPSEGFQVYLLHLKLFIMTATSLGLVIYIITWLRSLAQDRIAYQRSMERYVFDMNRASWTIETILELSSSELEELPAPWLESVTKNLFEAEATPHEDPSSLSALAALLNVTSEAEIGPDGPKFRINRRGAKKAASDAG